MNPNEIFSTRIRWLCVVVSISNAAFSFFLSPLASLSPVILALAAILQPRFPQIASWIVWIEAANWTLGLVPLSYAALLSLPAYRDAAAIAPVIFLLLSTVLFLWLDVELLIDGIQRIRHRRAKVFDFRPMGRPMLVFSVLLNFWAVVSICSVAHRGRHGLYEILNLLVWVVAAVSLDTRIISNQYARSVGHGLSDRGLQD